MEEFDLTHIEDYTIEQLASFVIAGNTTVQELYDGGLFRPLRTKLIKELESRDNIAWKEAIANGSVDAIDGYIAVYDQPSPNYHGKHVEEAKELKARIEQVEDTKGVDPEDSDPFESAESSNVSVTETPDALGENVPNIENEGNEDSGDVEINSLESATIRQEDSDTNEAEKHGTKESEAFSENDKEPIKTIFSIKNIKKWGLIGLIAMIVVILIPVVLHSLNRKSNSVPLTQDEIVGIIKNYQDSLKTEIFGSAARVRGAA